VHNPQIYLGCRAGYSNNPRGGCPNLLENSSGVQIVFHSCPPIKIGGYAQGTPTELEGQIEAIDFII
jgi:hypothetical protein